MDVAALTERQTDAIAVATVALALVAAVTGLILIGQERRLWRASNVPRLHAYGTRNIRSGTLQVVVTNAGGAPAVDPTFLIVTRDGYAEGPASPAFLGPGKEVGISIDTPIQDDEPIAAVISCRDTPNIVRAWSVGKKRLVRKRRPWRKHLPTNREILAKWSPDISLEKRRPLTWDLKGPI
jgi:hypothetical protein